MSNETTETVKPTSVAELRATNALLHDLPDLPEPQSLNVDKIIAVTLTADNIRGEFEKINGKKTSASEGGLALARIVKLGDLLARELVSDQNAWDAYTAGRSFNDLLSIGLAIVTFYEDRLGK